jgi:hypothetical protein
MESSTQSATTPSVTDHLLDTLDKLFGKLDEIVVAAKAQEKESSILRRPLPGGEWSFTPIANEIATALYHALQAGAFRNVPAFATLQFSDDDLEPAVLYKTADWLKRRPTAVFDRTDDAKNKPVDFVAAMKAASVFEALTVEEWAVRHGVPESSAYLYARSGRVKTLSGYPRTMIDAATAPPPDARPCRASGPRKPKDKTNSVNALTQRPYRCTKCGGYKKYARGAATCSCGGALEAVPELE